MKKNLISAALLLLLISKTEACSWYDPDTEYFNLFTQTIIKDKTYLPFLHTLSNRFYGHEHFEIPDENIENWQKYFGNKLNYNETKLLVQKMPMAELNNFKKGNSSNAILSKLGSYAANFEGIDYLIEAKYLEPFMSFSYVESPNSFYNDGPEADKSATQLDYAKTINALTSLYNAAKNPEIKLRYGYQLVRFNHYTHNYDKSVEAFKTYVQPLKLKSAPYFMALDQMAGAQRGLGNGTEANWNFFQVFSNSKSRKESAFISMKLSDSASVQNLIKRAETPSEKNMALFLLGYDEYNNPVSTMEKMYEIDPNSEILKVLAARSINDLERSYLPVYFNNDKNATTVSPKKNETTETETTKVFEPSFWQKIKNFFSSIFGGGKSDKSENGNNQSDSELLKNPNRIPKFTKNEYDETSKDFAADFKNITSKIKEKSNDEFWKITDAYLSFLQKNYDESTKTLKEIKTTNPEYLAEISRMKMLNKITAEPKITSEFEEDLYKNYKEFFVTKVPAVETDSLAENFGYDEYSAPSTSEFLKDILANRYFLQGEDAKSFLMNNQLSDLRFNPNLELTKDLQAFFNKANKTSFEKEIIAKNINDVGNTESFFNVIYGDFAMRAGDFEKAKTYYEKGGEFSGIPLSEGNYDYNTGEYVKIEDPSKLYNGFNNISELIFGHNYFVSYGSPENVTMQAERFVSEFPSIKPKMNKLELSEAVLQLKKVAAGKDEKAAKANQLIGNLLYNTSALGYYREVFVMDSDNSNGPKYHFDKTDSPFQFYYKNYSSNVFIKPDNFDLAIGFYKKSLEKTLDKEQKARILFQMASAEQGKFYQYEAQNSAEISYEDPNWSQKEDNQQKQMLENKNEKFRTYFAELKKNYSDTETSKELRGNCSYYDYFMKK